MHMLIYFLPGAVYTRWLKAKYQQDDDVKRIMGSLKSVCEYYCEFVLCLWVSR